jgi:hypothetical protein
MLAPALLLALAAAPPATEGPPTLAELREIAYRDVVEGMAVPLAGGLWRADGPANPGEETPRVQLLAEPFVTGDLDGDGAALEAAAMLASEGLHADAHRLLAVAARRGGSVVNLATYRLGARVRVVSLTLADGTLTAVVEQPIQDTDFFHSRTRTFIGQGDWVIEVLPLSALGSTWWRLIEIDGRPQPGPLQPWIGLSGRELVGTAVCDRFRVPVEQRGTSLVLGTIERRRGRCSRGMERRDERFFALLAGAQRFEPAPDAVTLVARDEKGNHYMLFANAGQVRDRKKLFGRDPRPLPRPPQRPTPEPAPPR